MRKDLIDIVCCPDDKEVLDLRDAKDDGHGDVISGKLHCPECGFDFPIEDGIPNLLPKEFHVKGKKASKGAGKAPGAASKGQATAPQAKKDASKGQTTASQAKGAASQGQGKGSKDQDIAKAAGSGNGPED